MLNLMNIYVKNNIITNIYVFNIKNIYVFNIKNIYILINIYIFTYRFL